jgi:osmotically-inducible protein OsmY
MPPARNYRGVGPRGAARRDSRILDDVNDRLTEDDWLDATDIEANVDAGEVTLSGSVDSREAKRRAEDIAASVSGVREVFNRLRIQSDRVGSIPGPAGQPSRRTRW